MQSCYQFSYNIRFSTWFLSLSVRSGGCSAANDPSPTCGTSQIVSGTWGNTIHRRSSNLSCLRGTHTDDTIYHRHNLCSLLCNFSMELDTNHEQHPLYSPSDKALNRKEDVESSSAVFQVAGQRSGQRSVNILERCQWIATCSCLLPLYILFLVWNTCSVLYANHIITHHLLHNAAVLWQWTFVKHLEKLFLSQFWASIWNVFS